MTTTHTHSKNPPPSARFSVVFASPGFEDRAHYYVQHDAVREAESFVLSVPDSTVAIRPLHGQRTMYYRGRRVNEVRLANLTH